MIYSPSEQRIAFDQSLATAQYSVCCLLAAFRLLGQPQSLIDIGCGDGHVVRAARDRGVKARGYDLYAPEPCDLTQSWHGEPAQWVLCWEVAEHLPVSAADTLCDSLVRALEPDGLLLFSAAIPGQGGSGHYNEQPHEYWRKRFERRGLKHQDASSRLLSAVFTAVASPAWWYGQNIQVFAHDQPAAHCN